MKNSTNWSGYSVLFIFTFLLLISCNNDDDVVTIPNANDNLENEINDFVWNAMNTHYYWQENIPNLSDTKFNSDNDYINFLNTYSDPEELYIDLQFEKGATDRFSFFIDDYDSYVASRRGVNDYFGFEFDAVFTTENEVIGYVTYVVPNSPANDAGIKRGDIFNEFNNIILNENNYGQFISAYYNDDTIKIGFANVPDGIPASNGKEEELTIRSVSVNPVHYSKIIEQSGKKIGYLVYNSFTHTYHEELNNVFKEFKDNGVTELVLDLRYNPGGRIFTASILASMINSNTSQSDIFSKIIYNSKNIDDSSIVPFLDVVYFFDKATGDVTNENSPVLMNRLNISNLYVLTSPNTASASELIINGLKPYLSEVFIIGETTYGKNVGSFAIYDSPDFSSNNINPNHKVALQPITSRIFNRDDQSEYTNGFDPHIEIREPEYAEFSLKPFGDPEEPLLKAALDQISGSSLRSKQTLKRNLNTRSLEGSILGRPHATDMYMEVNDKKFFRE